MPLHKSSRTSRLRPLLVAVALLIVGCGAPQPSRGQVTDDPFAANLIVPEVLVPDGTSNGSPLYHLPLRSASLPLSANGPLTALSTFGGTFPGPTFSVRADERIFVRYENDLSSISPLAPLPGTPPDGVGMPMSIPGHTVHLHGADVMGSSDGDPQRGLSRGQSVTFEYDNEQRASMQWYHDHILGDTREGVYAGLSGLYFIRSAEEDRLGLPSGEREVPLVLQDRTFAADGARLAYPRTWQREVFGDKALVNGRVTPHLDVDPVRYRLRVLNASNARFYHLALSTGEAFTLIGTDGGLLDRGVVVRDVTLAPAERADLVVDFSRDAGARVVLRNDAPAPYPRQDPGVPQLPELMQFRVRSSGGADTSVVPAVLSGFTRLDPASASRSRLLVLRAFKNAEGQTTQFQILNPALGEDVTAATPESARGAFLSDPMDVSSTPNDLLRETITPGSTEVWTFVNTTDVTHPMHLHLKPFQVLDRRLVDVRHLLSAGEVRYLAPAEHPTDPADTHFDPGMLGWKDTVRVDPGYALRVVVRFDTRNTGEFMLHCHILEHEDNDMMRAYHVR
ncbi:multicopper oxidase family protein [Deinococcus pimensis]|uniref:multicopper oxidase family protein n=1 Tax=Deinococcus pimensis TaxID=309888 RepID=UPI000693955A|nr:multicopper oxidase family protein [Deinococcus pimensis]